MLSIAIAEDEKSASDTLKDCILRYGKEFGKDFAIDIYSNTKSLLSALNSRSYGLLFTDIDRPEINGIDLAKKIREQDSKITIVFVTNLSQYALLGYEVSALDYILKPLTYEQFKIKRNRIVLNCQEKFKNDRIRVSTSDGKKVIPLENLVYIESDDHLLTYHLKDSSVDSFGTRKSLERSLPDSFYRCNSRYIVNLKQVSGIEKNEVVRKDKTRLRISRARKKDFLAALQSFFVQGGF